MNYDEKRKLIGLIRHHEVIYNSNLSEYKDHASRVEAWNQIAEDMKMKVEDCKVEWVKIRNSYVNALKRRVVLQKQRGRILPPWVFEADMSYLKPFVSGRSQDAPYTVLLPDLPYEIDVTDGIPIESIKDDIEDSETPRKRHKNKLTPKIEEETYNIDDNEEYTVNDEYKTNESSFIMKNSVNEMDESDMFFLAMSQTFKKLPKIEQCRLKMDMFKILNDAERRHLGGKKRNTSKRRSSSSESG